MKETLLNRTASKLFVMIVALLFATVFAVVPRIAYADAGYNLWVQGVQVTDDNKNDVLGDGGSVKFSWDESSSMGTLTLTNATLTYAEDPWTIDKDDMASIYSRIDLTINLVGENEIAPLPENTKLYGDAICGIRAYDSLAFTGEGSLRITTLASNDYFAYVAYGIVVSDDLTITDSSIVIFCGDEAIGGAYPDCYGINADSISVTDANLYVVSRWSSGVSMGIFSWTSVTIEGQSYVGSSGGMTDITESGSSSHGVYAFLGTLTVSDESTLDATSHQGKTSAGIAAMSLAVTDDARVTAQVFSSDPNVGLGVDSENISVADNAELAAMGNERALLAAPDISKSTCGDAYVSTDLERYSLYQMSLWDEVTPLGGNDSPYVIVQIPAKPTIMRIAGDYANQTSSYIASFVGYLKGSGSNVVVLARDDDYADALGATGLAGLFNCPIVLTDRTELSEAAAMVIKSLGAERVFVIGGSGAIKDQVVDDLVSECGIDAGSIERVWGENSYDTSLACAKMIDELKGAAAPRVIVAMSTNFQDALSISPIAYRYSMPVVLQTWGDTSADRGFTDEAKEYLTGQSLLVVGGPGAISDESLAGLQNDLRIYGETGYDTSERIAEWATDECILDTRYAVIACGAQAPKGVDALAGSALAGMLGGPILLVNSNEAMEPADTTTIDGYLTMNAKNVKSVFVLGGTYVIPQDLADQIATVIGARFTGGQG